MTFRSVFFIGSLLAVAACHRTVEKNDSSKASPPPRAPHSTSAYSEKPKRIIHGRATWYDVPKDSLAARRAKSGLDTAAYDGLAIGTVVRVLDETNGKSVLVEITDAGVGRKKTIDLSKDAATTIGLVKPGVAKVRIEVLQMQ